MRSREQARRLLMEMARHRQFHQCRLWMLVPDDGEIAPHQLVDCTRAISIEAMFQRITHSVHAKMFRTACVVAIEKWTLIGHTSHRL